MEALKSVTQKLKGITQSIPQQAILHKTGIIADSAVSETQKEAAKHKTARISLADAIGAAPLKNENAPMKSIRIKRPIDIPGATKAASKPETAPVEAADAAPVEAASSEPSSSVTQRKTLKIARPATGAVRPSKFGVKRPSAATAAPVAPSASAESDSAAAPAGEVADIPEIADIPPMPTVAAIPVAASASNDGPAWLCALSAIVQLAACIAIGALAWYLFQDTQISTF
jgi:hypothetical protein